MELDRAGHSTTYTCLGFRECYLCIDRPEFACLIWLRRFHRRRGEGPAQRPLDDLRMATRLVECLVLDGWPSPATVVDFGIETASHLGALQHAVRSGVTAYELDRVMGDGAAITRLVRAVPDQPQRGWFVTAQTTSRSTCVLRAMAAHLDTGRAGRHVEFRTSYDAMPAEDDDAF